MNTEKSIFLLNKFLAIQNERFVNYEINILETNEQDLKSLLYNYQKKCLACKSELISEIKLLGGKPIQDSGNHNKFMHFWLDIKNVFIHTNREDLLPICEYNEFLNIRRFSDVLENNSTSLNFHQLQMLNKQLVLIEKNHDHLKLLSEMLLSQNKGKDRASKLETTLPF